MEEKDRPVRTDNGRGVVIDFFRPEDAPGIVALFRRVYGDGYPISVYYDSDELIRSNENGKCCSIVARNELGEVVGATHLVRSAPFAHVYESAAGLVMPAYRNRGISGRLQRFLFERWVPVRHDIAGLFGEPVCNHIHVQKNWHDLGALETGLEVALMPASAYGSNTDKKGRVSCLSAYWAVADRPHKVHLPAVYEKALRFLYRGLT